MVPNNHELIETFRAFRNQVLLLLSEVDALLESLEQREQYLAMRDADTEQKH